MSTVIVILSIAKYLCCKKKLIQELKLTAMITEIKRSDVWCGLVNDIMLIVDTIKARNLCIIDIILIYILDFNLILLPN